MSTPTGVVLVSATEPVLGLWCDRCLLPSNASAQVCMTDETGSTVVGTVWFCTECGNDEAFDWSEPG